MNPVFIIKMTNLEKAKAIIYGISIIKEMIDNGNHKLCLKGNTWDAGWDCCLDTLLKIEFEKAKALKAEIKADGCKQAFELFSEMALCCGIYCRCPDCQEAIKIIDEVLN